jgi:thymidine phosphorylase
MGVALAALRLGAGRAKAEDRVDHAVGLTCLVKVGDRVSAGDPLCVVHSNDERAHAEAQEMLESAIVVGTAPVRPPPLVGEVIG